VQCHTVHGKLCVFLAYFSICEYHPIRETHATSRSTSTCMSTKFNKIWAQMLHFMYPGVRLCKTVHFVSLIAVCHAYYGLKLCEGDHCLRLLLFISFDKSPSYVLFCLMFATCSLIILYFFRGWGFLVLIIELLCSRCINC
jgi:hypothetical protein